MSNWKIFLGYLIAFILQPLVNVVIPGEFEGCNLILAVTVAIVFLHQETEKYIVFGVVFSLLTDIVNSIYTGPAAISMIVVCGFVLVFKIFFNHENYINSLLVLLISTWVYNTVYWVVYALIGSPYTYAYAMKTIPVAVIVNAIVGFVVYAVQYNRVIKFRNDRYFK